jgi:hypothetical protein
MTAAQYEVHDPATLELVGHAPENTAADVELAVAAARTASAGWAADREARRRALSAGAALIRRDLDALSTLLSGTGQAQGRLSVSSPWPTFSNTTRTSTGEEAQQHSRALTCSLKSSTGPWDRRRHHAVELPHFTALREARSRPGGRLHRDRQALAVHAPVHHCAG